LIERATDERMFNYAGKHLDKKQQIEHPFPPSKKIELPSKKMELPSKDQSKIIHCKHTFLSGLQDFFAEGLVTVAAQHNQSKKNEERNRILLRIHIGTPDLCDTQ
jgi:hypothetical protein